MEKRRKDECNAQRKVSQISEKNTEAPDDCGQMDDIIGGFGKYQFMIFMFKILIGVTSAFNNLGVTFFAPNDFISFRCADMNNLDSSNPLSSNVSLLTNLRKTHGYDLVTPDNYFRNKTLNITIVKDEQIGILHQLGEFALGSERKYKHSLHMSSDTPKNLRKECEYWSSIDNMYHKCKSYQYDTGIWISTIIDEWDLVCDRAWFISVTQSLYMSGFIVSYLMFGYFSDRFGRWKSLLLGAIIEILSGFGCAFSSSITQFMIFRFMLGLGNAGRSSSSYLIMIEWTGVRWRMHISTLGSLGWIIGYCMMPWIVLFFLHFRHMQLFVCFYEFIFLIWLLRLPESPRWLLTHRRFNEAYDVLMMAAKYNGLILKKDHRDKSKNELTTIVQDSDTLIGRPNLKNNIGYKETLGNGENTDSKRVPQNGDRTNEKGYEIKHRKNSLTSASDESSTKVKTPRNNGICDFFIALCSPFTIWFCGEGQAKDLKPYTEEEYDLKFKRLTNIIEAKEFTKNEDRLSILDLFKWKNLRKYTFILAFAWAVNSFIYYGIALRVGDFGGTNLFVAFTFAGATEIPSILFTLICMKMLPRRTTNQFLFSTIFVLCALQVPLRYFNCQSLQQMTMMLAKLFNSCSFICILYQTMELFPTSIRQTAYSSCSLAGRIGSILAPFIKELSQLTNTLVPPIIYAVLSILEVILIRYLPETQGVDLPDTLLEAEKFRGTDKMEKKDSEKLDDVERGELVN